MNIMRKEISAQVALIGLAVFLSLALASTVYGIPVTGITVEPSDSHATAGASYKVNFTLPGNAASTTVIDLTFPLGFGVSSAGPNPVSVTGMAQKFAVSVSGQIVRLATTTAGSATSSTAQSVTITGIVNHQQSGGYTLSFAATTSAGAATGTSATFYIEPGSGGVVSDTTAPVSKITSPALGAVIAAGQSYTIEGTGTDNASSVTKVEVSVDGGKTWSLAQVSASVTHIGASYTWSYVWANPADGEYAIKVRAADSVGNVESPGPSVTVKVGVGAPAVPTTPEKPITEMTVSELQQKLNELRQTLLNLLQKLVQLLQQQLQALSR
jgi:hypothetical protein